LETQAGGIVPGLGDPTGILDAITRLETQAGGIVPGLGDPTGILDDILGLETRAGGMGLGFSNLADFKDQLTGLEERAGSIVLPDVPDLPDPVPPGDGVVGEPPIIPPADDGPPAEPTGLDALLQELQAVVSAMTSGPTDAAGLREDPLTASLLADLEARQRADRAQAFTDLNRLGVLRSGNTADVLGELLAGQGRAELDVLGDAAERYRRDRSEGLSGGTNLFGTAAQREAQLEQLRQTSLQTDLDIIAAITAALDSKLNLDTESSKQRQLANMLLGLTGVPDEQRAQMLKVIGFNPDEIADALRAWKIRYPRRDTSGLWTPRT
jgi:hypothetical protein